MITNIYDSTLDLIGKEVDTQLNPANFHMMENLVKLMGEHDWNQLVQSYMDSENTFEEFFYRFHKQFRQVNSFDLSISKNLGKLKDDELKRWTEYAKKHNYTLEHKIIGHVNLYMNHANGHLDMLFWHLIHTTDKVELIMHHLWNMNEKGHENSEDYFWSGDNIDFWKSKRKKRLTEENK